MTSSARTVMHVVSSGGFYGAERAIVELSAGLIDGGWKSHIFAIDSRGQPSLVDVARAQEIPTLTVADNSGVRTLHDAVGRAIDEQGVDIVHSHGYKGDLLVAMLSLPGSVRRVATCHGWITTSPKLAVYEMADKVALRRFDRIAAVSTPIRESLVRWRVGGNRVTLVENGVDPPAPRSDARERIRAALGVTPSQHMVLVASRLDRGKGIGDVVHAVKRLIESGQDLVLAVAGDGEESEHLRQLGVSLGVADRVLLLGYRSDISDLMAAADVFVIASYAEGLPITLIEAMALACPIVATRVGEIASVLESGECGRLLERGDVDALVTEIGYLLTRPEEARRLATAAFQKYASRYSRAAMAERYLGLYDSLN